MTHGYGSPDLRLQRIPFYEREGKGNSKGVRDRHKRKRDDNELLDALVFERRGALDPEGPGMDFSMATISGCSRLGV